MMHRTDNRNRRGTRAFTLIELLVATMIAAVVLAAMNAAFYAAMHLRSRTTDAVEDRIPMNHSLSILKADLRGVVVTGGLLAGSMASPGAETVNGQLSLLDVYTTTGGVNNDLPWGDVQKVSYYLKDPAGVFRPAGRDLIRAVTRNLLASVQPDVTEQVLLSNVTFLEFSFYDGANWQTTWDSTMAATPTPQVVKVQIEFATGGTAGKRDKLPIGIVVPVITQQPTNGTSTASATSGTGGGG